MDLHHIFKDKKFEEETRRRNSKKLQVGDPKLEAQSWRRYQKVLKPFNGVFLMAN